MKGPLYSGMRQTQPKLECKLLSVVAPPSIISNLSVSTRKFVFEQAGDDFVLVRNTNPALLQRIRFEPAGDTSSWFVNEFNSDKKPGEPALYKIKND